jgi:hypothetical protein
VILSVIHRQNPLGSTCMEGNILCFVQYIFSRLPIQCGIPNISQPYRPPRPVTGTALLLLRCIHCAQYSLYCLCSFVCCVLFERGVVLCDMRVTCVLCLIVVPMPPGRTHFQFN